MAGFLRRAWKEKGVRSNICRCKEFKSDLRLHCQVERSLFEGQEIPSLVPRSLREHPQADLDGGQPGQKNNKERK